MLSFSPVFRKVDFDLAIDGGDAFRKAVPTFRIFGEKMFNHNKIIHSLLLAGCLAVSASAHAAVTTIYNFGSLLTGTGPNSFASNPFAQLAATDNGGGVWVFQLTVNNNLFSSFGNGAFLGSMTFDFTPDPIPAKPPTLFLGSNVTTLTNVVTAT